MGVGILSNRFFFFGRRALIELGYLSVSLIVLGGSTSFFWCSDLRGFIVVHDGPREDAWGLCFRLVHFGVGEPLKVFNCFGVSFPIRVRRSFLFLRYFEGLRCHS